MAKSRCALTHSRRGFSRSFGGAERLTRLRPRVHLSPSSCPVNNKSHVLWCASLCSSRLGFAVFKFLLLF